MAYFPEQRCAGGYHCADWEVPGFQADVCAGIWDLPEYRAGDGYVFKGIVWVRQKYGTVYDWWTSGRK